MKTIYFSIFVLLLISFSAIGQPYHSIFGPDTTRWNVFEMAPDAGGTWAQYTFSDTIINDLLYHKIYLGYLTEPNGDYTHNADIHGYLHEDTLTGKYRWLYFDWKGNKYEAVFMDMGLKQGDTFEIISDFRYFWKDSAIVDTVYYVDYRKIIELGWMHYAENYNYEQKLKFIEGIGPSNGFYMGIDDMSPEDYTLLCKFENSELVYSTSDNYDGDCWEPGGASVEENGINNKQIYIYPNPSDSKFNIEVKDFDFISLKYEVYNILGQEYLSGKITSSVTTINITQNGFYYLVISDGNHRTTRKLMINGN